MARASHQQQELSTLDTAKGSGPDDLHPFMLEILADFLAEPVTALYNKSLLSGEISQDWRKAIICPIFKQGGPEDAAYYRPVSLTFVLCKICEKLLKKALLLFFYRDTIPFTESAWISSSSILLIQPYPLGRTCHLFVG